MFRRRIVPRRELLFWTSLIVLVVAIKTTLLLFDRLPIFYLGDSAVYISSAISDSMPNDRSFTYGLFFIRPVLTMFGSLEAVVAAQAFVSGATCILAGICMRVGFDAPLWIVAATAIACAFEPLALLQERLILAETVALFFLALFVLVGLFYIRQPRWYPIPLLALIGTVALSLRTSFVPVMLIATASVVILGAPRLWELATDRRNFLRVLALHALVAAVATAGFHEAYKQYFSYMTQSRPAYNAGGGFFLIASWAPLITRADFPNERVANRILSNVKHDLSKRSARPVHRFWRDGLVGAIVKAENGNEYLAQKLAGKIAKKAALRDPMGVVRLAWETYGDFWDDRIMDWRLKSEQGVRELPSHLIKHFNEQYDEDLSRHHLQSTATKQWHRSAAYWYRFLLLTPLLSLLTIVIAGAYRASSAFIAILVCALMVVNCALVTEAVFRYLQPVAWLTILQLGQVLCAVSALWRRQALAVAGERPEAQPLT
jgi:hypothetical protein